MNLVVNSLVSYFMDNYAQLIVWLLELENANLC